MAARTLSDHCVNVFSGILTWGNQNIDLRRNRIALMRGKLTEEHFADNIQQLFYRVLSYYEDQTGEVIGKQELEDFLEEASDRGTAALLLELHESYSKKDIPEDVFLFSIEQIREKKASKETVDAFTVAMEILRNGKIDDKGNELRGQKDAREYLIQQSSKIDKELSFQESPEGNIRNETADMWKEYEERVELNESGGFTGVQFGIDLLDEQLGGGAQYGDLVLAIGWTSSGKSSLCVQLAWWAAVMQGLNVVYITNETLRGQVRRKLISRHSCLPMFGLGGGTDAQGKLLPGGLNTRDIRFGRLNPAELEAYKETLSDMGSNPEYGSIDVIQMPMGGTTQDAFSRVNRIAKDKKVDVLVLDYLELFRPTTNRAVTREALNDTVLESKEYARTANNGAGTVVISPWQVKRDAHEEALMGSSYSLASLGETKKAADTPDTVISVLNKIHEGRKSRVMETELTILKQRDGETPPSFKVDVDFATSCWSNAKTSQVFGLDSALSTLGDISYAGN